jgi:hypothetical protein
MAQCYVAVSSLRRIGCKFGVSLSVSEGSAFFFRSGYEKQILRLRLRMTSWYRVARDGSAFLDYLVLERNLNFN